MIGLDPHSGCGWHSDVTTFGKTIEHHSYKVALTTTVELWQQFNSEVRFSFV